MFWRLGCFSSKKNLISTIIRNSLFVINNLFLFYWWNVGWLGIQKSTSAWASYRIITNVGSSSCRWLSFILYSTEIYSFNKVCLYLVFCSATLLQTRHLSSTFIFYIYLLHLSSTFIFYIYLLHLSSTFICSFIGTSRLLWTSFLIMFFLFFAIFILPISIFIKKMDTILLSIGWLDHYSIYYIPIPVPVYYSTHYALLLIFPSILILLIFEFF